MDGGGIVRGAATATMDALAEEGMRAASFNVLGQCTPSRVALVTDRHGMHSGNHTIPIAGGSYGRTQWDFALAEMLKGAEYNTAMLG